MNELLYLKEKTKLIFLIIILVVIILSLSLVKIRTYKEYSGIVKCSDNCNLILQIPVAEVSFLTNYKYLTIENNKKVEYSVEKIEDLEIINASNYYNVLLTTKLDQKYQLNNLVVNIKIFTNKEVLIKKIIKEVLK